MNFVIYIYICNGLYECCFQASPRAHPWGWLKSSLGDRGVRSRSAESAAVALLWPIVSASKTSCTSVRKDDTVMVFLSDVYRMYRSFHLGKGFMMAFSSAKKSVSHEEWWFSMFLKKMGIFRPQTWGVLFCLSWRIATQQELYQLHPPKLGSVDHPIGALERPGWKRVTDGAPAASQEYLGITLSHLFDALGESTDTGRGGNLTGRASHSANG